MSGLAGAPCIGYQKLSGPDMVKSSLLTKDGIYMQPMLIDQLKYLQSMLSRADQKPGTDAYLRLNELKRQFDLLKKELDS